MRSAVLFLVFNRPDTTRQVFEAIRAAEPPRLYVAADGPREHREGEAERCAEVRRIATNVDWPCEVRTLFQDRNLGCGLSPVQGIDWFFQHEEEGLVLEDDILPLPSFFVFCDELLRRYRDDERVGLISGNNPISKRLAPQYSYFFSRHIRISGWASWRRAWKHYDVAMQTWPVWRDQGGLKRMSDGNKFFAPYYRKLLDRTFRGGVDWWDYQWTFACWSHGMFAALPAQNQVENLGYGPGGTHTTMTAPVHVRESTPEPMPFPLRHPPRVERDLAADALMDRNVCKLTPRGSVRRHLMRIKRLVRNTPVLGEFLKRAQRALRALFSSR
jgi:hypothetical protein